MQYIFRFVPPVLIWVNETLFIAEYLVFVNCARSLLCDVSGEKRGWFRVYRTKLFQDQTHNNLVKL